MSTNLNSYITKIETCQTQLRPHRAVMAYPTSSFDEDFVARLVTKFITTDYEGVEEEYAVVYRRNPYGTHNLLLLCDGVAYRHGNWAVREGLLHIDSSSKQGQRAFRKAVAFIATRIELNKEKAQLQRRLDRAYDMWDKQEAKQEGAMYRALKAAGLCA